MVYGGGIETDSYSQCGGLPNTAYFRKSWKKLSVPKAVAIKMGYTK